VKDIKILQFNWKYTSNLLSPLRVTTISSEIFERAITIWRAIQKRSDESMYITTTKN
jgi:hypothetical protein